jgi:phthalate 4,5-cis-dihydrodiol dehydrogenase
VTSDNEGGPVLGLGVVGLGGASLAMIPKFAKNPGYRIAAAADIDEEILGRFRADNPDTETYVDMEQLCKSASVDLVYIATPNRLHSEHARIALENKKHVLIEKPMTITLDEADVMIKTAEDNGVLLGVNVKHSFEPRVLKLSRLAASQEFGRLRMINSWRYADWLYRPRTGEELTPEFGGGILWRQGPHQFDILRTIGGGMVRSVRGMAATWDPARRVPGSHAAFLDFEDGAVATAIISGYDHFDSRQLVYGPETFDPAKYAQARRELREANDPDWEANAAREERYGGGRSDRGPAVRSMSAPGGGWVMGGPVVISFDHADVVFSPNGLDVYGDESRWEVPLTGPNDGRDGRINTYYDAIVNGTPLPADGRWGMATLEVLLAIEESGASRADVQMSHQVPTVT